MKRAGEVKANKSAKGKEKYWSALDGKGYNGLRFKDAQRLMNMSCSELAEKASLNTNPI